ncbi:MAG: phosphatase PAP2 family protein [Oscillospiraceae bacterium]|nr:phosphatase PAP2 family protein [Oscillospiraceae bacterium]
MQKKNSRKITRAEVKAFAYAHKHILWAVLVAAFITAFLLLNAFVTNETYYVTYSPLDDYIPFVPQFIWFYYGWFPLLGTVGFFLLFADAPVFRRYVWALMLGMFLCLGFYVIFPSGQNLRPADGLIPVTVSGNMLRGLYAFDTNTNVLPSMHVYAAIVAFVALADCRLSRRTAVLIPAGAFCLLVCAATVLIKQHSIIDIFAAAGLAAVICPFVFVFIKRKQARRAARISRGEYDALTEAGKRVRRVFSRKG